MPLCPVNPGLGSPVLQILPVLHAVYDMVQVLQDFLKNCITEVNINSQLQSCPYQYQMWLLNALATTSSNNATAITPGASPALTCSSDKTL